MLPISTKGCPPWTDDNRRNESDFLLDCHQAHTAARAASTAQPLTTIQICNWHFVMCKRVAPSYYAGNFRQIHPEMPCLALPISFGSWSGADASMVRPLVVEIIRRMELDFSDYDREWANMTHEQRLRRFSLIVATLLGDFIRVHPFINANGRTSRLLWSWALARYGQPAQCAIADRPAVPYADLMNLAVAQNYLPLAVAILSGLNSQPKPPQT